MQPDSPSHTEHVISTNGWKAERIWYPDKPLFESTLGLLMDLVPKSKNEQCGFLTTDQSIIPVLNVHEEPTHNYFMDVEQTQLTLEQIFDDLQSDVMGIWHTHPNDITWPTPRDIVGWPDLRLGWRYWIVTHNDVLEWEKVRD